MANSCRVLNDRSEKHRSRSTKKRRLTRDFCCVYNCKILSTIIYEYWKTREKKNWNNVTTVGFSFQLSTGAFLNMTDSSYSNLTTWNHACLEGNSSECSSHLKNTNPKAHDNLFQGRFPRIDLKKQPETNLSFGYEKKRNTLQLLASPVFFVARFCQSMYFLSLCLMHVLGVEVAPKCAVSTSIFSIFTPKKTHTLEGSTPCTSKKLGVLEAHSSVVSGVFWVGP